MLPLKGVLDRIAAQGLAASVGYYLGTVLLGKCGVHVLAVYRNSGSPEEPRPSGGVVVTTWEQLEIADRGSLETYGGRTVLANFSHHFDRGDRAVVLRVRGEFACVCWLRVTAAYAPSRGREAALIQNGFTLPAHRGAGLHPQVLRLGTALLLKEDAARPVFVESSIFNRGSLHGIEKAGFIRTGLRIEALGFDRFVPFHTTGRWTSS